MRLNQCLYAVLQLLGCRLKIAIKIIFTQCSIVFGRVCIPDFENLTLQKTNLHNA